MAAPIFVSGGSLLNALKRLFHLKTLRIAMSIVVMALLWILLVPLQVGGQTTYVIVNGNSMEPMLYKGDLVLLRAQAEYEVDDIVTYKHPNIGPVIHRIIDRNLDHYVLQGDNNHWIDRHEPTFSEITGKYWFHIPGAGKILLSFRQPWILALVAGLSTLIIGMSMFESNDPQTTALAKSPKKPSSFTTFLNTIGALLADWKDNFWLLIYILAAGGILLGVFAFTRPATRKSTDEMLYQQTGFFSYSGSATDEVYDYQKIETGDPIYPALGCTVDFTYTYWLHTPKDFSGGGTYAINAMVSDNSGWHRIIPITPETSFEGATFQTDQIMDICTAQELIDDKHTATGAFESFYSLSLIPEVNINGIVDGQILEDRFAPQLTFMIEPEQVYLSQNIEEGQDPFAPGTVGILSRDKIVPNLINIFQLQLSVPTARIIAIVCVVLAAMGTALASFAFKEAETQDERLWAKMQIGEHMLEINASPVGDNDRLVDLASLDELIQLVERYGGAVLYHELVPYANYYVRDDGVVYRYRQVDRKYLLGGEEYLFQQEILRALKNDEFALQFQPSVSLTSGEITQVEAFLRWEHPERGLLPPMSFLPEAEASNMVTWIDDWVIRTGCSQLRKWRKAGYPQFPMSINLSSTQLRQENIVETIQKALLENDLSADSLQIEISEDQFNADIEIQVNLERLQKLGVGITVSSSNKNLLLDTPRFANQVKVDYNILQETMMDESTETTQQWVANARAKKVKVVAMRVETHEQLDFLQLNAFDEAQGYCVRPPLSANELSQELDASHTLLDLTAKPDEA